MVSRQKVMEVTLDMAGSMNRISRRAFPNATKVIDRFHVQKLALEAVQELRIKFMWDAMDRENEEMLQAKLDGREYRPDVLPNGAHGSSCSSGAGISCTGHRINGRSHRRPGRGSCSTCIPTSLTPIPSPTS